jgi:exonuclease SbcD
MGHEVVGPLDYDAAVRLVLDSVRERPEYAASSANVAVAHQFVTASGAAPTRCDSERLSLGTLDNVDVSAFDGFDYVALGHVHGPQRVGRDTVRYAGSPLKYSASEIDQRKSFAVVDVEPGEVPSVELVPMAPLHGFRRERGGFDELLDRGRGEDEATRADFVQAVVTDDEEPVDVAARLRAVWPDLVGVEFDNARTNAAGARSVAEVEATTADVAGLFSDFFDQQVGRAMSDSERQVMRSAMAEDRGEDPHGEVAAGTYAAGGVVA